MIYYNSINIIKWESNPCMTAHNIISDRQERVEQANIRGKGITRAWPYNLRFYTY